MMKAIRVLLSVAILAGLVALPSLAAEESKPAPAPEQTALQKVAVYAVPELDQAKAKELVKQLSTVAGVVSAKADLEKSQLLVTFKPEETSTEKLTAALVAAAPQAKLQEVLAADGKAAHDCGKCPMNPTCPKGKKD
jgi:copper chaperone CopZ